MEGNAATENQQLLAESGLGGHSAQNWASHTRAFAHAQVWRKMTVCMQGEERYGTVKGEKTYQWGPQKRCNC